jgi:hypothetical protein
MVTSLAKSVLRCDTLPNLSTAEEAAVAEIHPKTSRDFFPIFGRDHWTAFLCGAPRPSRAHQHQQLRAILASAQSRQIGVFFFFLKAWPSWSTECCLCVRQLRNRDDCGPLMAAAFCAISSGSTGTSSHVTSPATTRIFLFHGSVTRRPSHRGFWKRVEGTTRGNTQKSCSQSAGRG